ncbi:MAG: helicase C-terminal domain-containing protein [Acidobacteriota bacterium]
MLADALAGDAPATSTTQLLSFIDQVECSDRIREIIDVSPYLASDQDLRFRWQRLKNKLREANLYVSLNSIWIRPYVYPLIANEYYAQTKQRLYMSATVGDPGDLSRRLGVKRIVKVPVPAMYAEATSGRRFVVINRIEDADIPKRLQAVILAVLRTHPKSVWLCSSETEARKLQKVVSKWLAGNGLGGHPTWLLTPLGDEVDQFKSSPTGHLFVAGRFDGMDFQADECRLVVLTTLPRAINTQEEFISAYLRDSGFMLRRLNQRIVQALGRCNRSEDDFGVYVLADRRFASHFGRDSNKEGIPRNVIAEIDMAQDLADAEDDVVVGKVERFLKGDFVEYDRQLAECVSDVPVQSAAVDTVDTVDTSEYEVTGWAALFESQNYQKAAERFELCWEVARVANLREIAALYGWQLAKALYLQSLLNDPSARERSLQVLENAIQREAGAHGSTE